MKTLHQLKLPIGIRYKLQLHFKETTETLVISSAELNSTLNKGVLIEKRIAEFKDAFGETGRLVRYHIIKDAY